MKLADPQPSFVSRRLQVHILFLEIIPMKTQKQADFMEALVFPIRKTNPTEYSCDLGRKSRKKCQTSPTRARAHNAALTGAEASTGAQIPLIAANPS